MPLSGSAVTDPPSLGSADKFKAYPWEKTASMDLLASMVITRGLVSPLASPVQPVKAHGVDADAVNVT